MTEETQVQTKPQDPKEYWAGFPEAPFSDSFKWVDEQGFEHLSTARGWQFSTLLTTIQRAESSIIDSGGKPVNSKPVPMPPSTIQVRDESGLPVVDQDHNPVMTNLPAGVHLFQVAGFAHDQTKSGKDVLKVWTVEEPYNKGYGVSCFHPPADLSAWKSWPMMSKENKTRYAPPVNCSHVLIRDPKEQGGYPDIVEFRA